MGEEFRLDYNEGCLSFPTAGAALASLPSDDNISGDEWIEGVVEESGMRPFQALLVEGDRLFFRDELVPCVVVDEQVPSRFKGWFWGDGDPKWAALGQSRPEVIRNLSQKVTKRFCELYFLLPEERTEVQKADWATLSYWVDVPRTLAAWPTRVKQAVEVVADNPWRVFPYGGVESGC